MNKENRKDLEKAVSLIEQAREIVEAIKDGEQEKYDSLTEGLQQSERGQKFEQDASDLDDIFNQLDEAIENINTITE